MHNVRDKYIYEVAVIFSLCNFCLTIKAFIRNKELSNWFSPRVVGGFSRVTLTKNQRVKNLCVANLIF